MLVFTGPGHSTDTPMFSCASSPRMLSQMFTTAALDAP
jgi:hypothetical protein